MGMRPPLSEEAQGSFIVLVLSYALGLPRCNDEEQFHLATARLSAVIDVSLIPVSRGLSISINLGMVYRQWVFISAIGRDSVGISWPRKCHQHGSSSFSSRRVQTTSHPGCNLGGSRAQTQDRSSSYFRRGNPGVLSKISTSTWCGISFVLSLTVRGNSSRFHFEILLKFKNFGLFT